MVENWGDEPAPEEEAPVESGPDEPTVFEAPVVVGVDTPNGKERHVADSWEFAGSTLVLRLDGAIVASYAAGAWSGCAATGEPVG